MNIKRKQFPIKIKEVSKPNELKLKLFPPPLNMEASSLLKPKKLQVLDKTWANQPLCF